jgi:hypothetical protein
VGFFLPTTGRRARPATFRGTASCHYFNALGSILLEKFKDILGYFVGGVGGGRAGIDPNPNNDGTESLLPILSVGDEASGINGRVVNVPIFHQFANLGTDSAPLADVVERGAVDSMKRLDRLIGVSALGWI